MRVSSGGTLDVARYGRVRMWGSVGFIAAVTASGFILQAAGVGWFPLLVSGLLAPARRRRLAPAGVERAAAGASASGRRALGPAPAGGRLVLRRRLPDRARPHQPVRLLFALPRLARLRQGRDRPALGSGRGRRGRLVLVPGALAVALVDARAGWSPPRSHRRCASRLIAAFGAWVVVLVFAQCLHALTFAAQHSAIIAVITRHFPGRLRGRGQALYAVLGYGASGVLGGVAGGALSELMGFAAVFWAASAVALAGRVVLPRGPCAPRARRPERARVFRRRWAQLAPADLQHVATRRASRRPGSYTRGHEKFDRSSGRRPQGEAPDLGRGNRRRARRRGVRRRCRLEGTRWRPRRGKRRSWSCRSNSSPPKSPCRRWPGCR